MELLNAIKARRSIYNIGKDIDLFDEELINMIKYNLKHTPSAYNSQSQRIMILLHDYHEKFWDLVLASLKKIVSSSNFFRTETKINNFKAGYGTVLFFDDEAVTNNLLEKYPLYKHNILTWREQHNAMLQINIWTSLASKDIGASLQHYQEVVETVAKEKFEIPNDWKLIAQMPFGNILKPPTEKVFKPIEDRLIIKK